MKISSNKQKEIVFFFKPRDKLQQPQQQPQQQQQNNHRPTEEIQSASSDSMPEIALNYQPHPHLRVLSSLKPFMVNKNTYDIANIFGEESERRHLIFGRF